MKITVAVCCVLGCVASNLSEADRSFANWAKSTSGVSDFGDYDAQIRRYNQLSKHGDKSDAATKVNTDKHWAAANISNASRLAMAEQEATGRAIAVVAGQDELAYDIKGQANPENSAKIHVTYREDMPIYLANTVEENKEAAIRDTWREPKYRQWDNRQVRDFVQNQRDFDYIANTDYAAMTEDEFAAAVA